MVERAEAGGRAVMVGMAERALIAGGVAFAGHIVVLGVLSAAVPARDRATPPEHVAFEMSPIPPPPEVVPAVSPVPHEPATTTAAVDTKAIVAKLLDNPKKRERDRAAMIEAEVSKLAVLRVLGDEGGSALDVAGGKSLSDVLSEAGTAELGRGADIGELSAGTGGGGVRAGTGGGLRTGTGGEVRVGTGVGPKIDGPSATAGAGRGRVDSETVRAAIQAKVRYPREAESLGVEGTVRVAFEIDDTGQPRQVRVVRSVDETLDEAAIEAVEAAAPFDSPPGRVLVPVRFTLPTP